MTFDQYTTFILDTNVLNHIFTQQISDGFKILKLLIKYQKQLWIPHTVYYEFCQMDLEKFKSDKMREFKNISVELKNEFDTYKYKIESIGNKAKSKGFFNWNTFISSYLQKLNDFSNTQMKNRDSIDEKEYMEKLLELIVKVQRLLKDLLENNQVGIGFSFDELLLIASEGEKRYSLLIPPGFSDNGKKGIQKYNDLFIWKEIINFIKESGGGDIAFITDDFKKGNWWETNVDKKHIPCKMLMKEFKEACPDDYEYKFTANLTFKTLTDFLNDNKKYFGTISPIDDKEMIKDSLLVLFKEEISDKLNSFVYNLDPTEIDDLYSLPNNDGEIGCDDIEVDSYDIQVDEDTLTCKLLVTQLFYLNFAYEDKEGDSFKMGESEIQVFATVTISGKSNLKHGEEFLSLDRNDYNISSDNISYHLISNSN